MLSVSPGGHTIVGWNVDSQHWVSSSRAPDGELGPVEDVRPDCERVE